MPCHPESRAAVGFLANTFQVNRTVLALTISSLFSDLFGRQLLARNVDGIILPLLVELKFSSNDRSELTESGKL
jgi:hypothetical protein